MRRGTNRSLSRQVWNYAPIGRHTGKLQPSFTIFLPQRFISRGEVVDTRLEGQSNSVPGLPAHAASVGLAIRIDNQTKGIGDPRKTRHKNTSSAIGDIENRTVDRRARML